MDDVLGVIERWADKQPDKLLYVFLEASGAEVERLSYSAFLERIELIAGQLRDRFHFKPQDRLMLAYPPGLEMIAAFFACARAGFLPVPVQAPTAHGASAALFRMEHIALNCQARGVLTTGKCLKWMRSEEASLSPFLSQLTWMTTDDWVERAAPTSRRPASEILFLQYTSGSTSEPKGVVVSHANVLANSKLVLDHEQPVAVSWLPHHHDMGLIGYYINTALGGGTLYAFSPTTFIQRPALWLETISRKRGTASSAPNFAFEHCLLPGRIPDATRAKLDLSSLKFLMAAAEPVKPAVYREFIRTFEPCGLRPETFVTAYGLAENTLAVSSYGRRTLSVSRIALSQGSVRPTIAVSEIGAATHLLSCGNPLGDNEVVIVNPDTRRRIAPGQTGEIWIAGASKCLGYWGNPQATRDIFEAEIADEPENQLRFLRTGDLGFMYEEELYICGRRKDLLIVRGQNYFPQDIETIVEQTVGVRRGGVVAFDVGSEADFAASILVLVEIDRRSPKPDLKKIADAVRAHLGLEVYGIVLVPSRSLPKTTSGKLMRYQAREMWCAGELAIICEFIRTKASNEERPVAAVGSFAFLRKKFGLVGNEVHSLIDAGLDSLDLVEFLHEFAELLSDKGARDLADQVDIRLVQQMSIAELFSLAQRFEQSPSTAASQLRRLLSRIDERRQNEERLMMQSDRHLSFEPPPRTIGMDSAPSRKILLTGATGFLGPFLLASLIEQTEASICALVRGTSPSQAAERLRQSLVQTFPNNPDCWRGFDERVSVVCGALDHPSFGLTANAWQRLAGEIDTIYHNGALVNYLYSYRRMRAANVLGTNEALRLAFEQRPKIFNYISTTFVFGWATKSVLYEADCNQDMEYLDFGYSQSKWVAEQIVLDARRRGLVTRIFRPALITPGVKGEGAKFDITLRLLSFMVKHGIGIDAFNQVSFMPADITANNIVAIANLRETANGTFHVTRDDYANMMDVTGIITALTGRRFDIFDLTQFVPQVIYRCTRNDLLFPLLDFLVGSKDNISAMEFKRYDSANYRRARAATPWGRPDPPFDDVVAGILRFMQRNGSISLPNWPLALARFK